MGRDKMDYPISEIFGPTRQGEGPQAGLEVFFVRFAGCDWDCSWCDTKYAVLPKYPGWHKEDMTAAQIIMKLHELGARAGSKIVLSGGNPALFVNHSFVNALRGEGLELAMETQGSVNVSEGVSRGVDCLVVSPKPPSSGMHTKYNKAMIAAILNKRSFGQITAVKFVAFDRMDLDWIYERYVEIQTDTLVSGLDWYISVGTLLAKPPAPIPDLPYKATLLLEQEDEILHDARITVVEGLSDLWLMSLKDPTHRFRNFKIMPQLHTLVWGQKAGV